MWCSLYVSGIFPEPHTDAVIQIANMVKIEGDNEPFIRNCFVTGETAPVIGSDIIVCKDEKELLEVICFLLSSFQVHLTVSYKKIAERSL